MTTKPYFGGSAAEPRDEGCPMLYKVYLIARCTHEAGAVSVSSVVTVSGLHNAEAYAQAFAHNPEIEVVIKPDTFGYIKKKHPHLSTKGFESIV